MRRRAPCSQCRGPRGAPAMLAAALALPAATAESKQGGGLAPLHPVRATSASSDQPPSAPPSVAGVPPSTAALPMNESAGAHCCGDIAAPPIVPPSVFTPNSYTVRQVVASVPP